MTLRRTEMRRGQHRINPVSAKRRSLMPTRRKAETALGREGTVGMCARCLRITAVNGHERQGGSHRSQTFMDPSCLLCLICNGEIEDNPRKSAEDGWKISGKWDPDPDLGPHAARTLMPGVFHHFEAGR